MKIPVFHDLYDSKLIQRSRFPLKLGLFSKVSSEKWFQASDTTLNIGFQSLMSSLIKEGA